MAHHLLITEDPLDLAGCMEIIKHPAAGGNALFVGTVRNKTKGKNVTGLHFESYRPMALSEMQKIADAISGRWQVLELCIHHRVGHLQIGEIPVIIAVASAHRDAAFAACEFAIDTLKQTVPIWKKEFYDDGSHWVAAHP